MCSDILGSLEKKIFKQAILANLLRQNHNVLTQK